VNSVTASQIIILSTFVSKQSRKY